MTNKEAARILAEFNQWRKGDGYDHMPKPSEIPLAINHAVKVLSEREKHNEPQFICHNCGEINY